MMQEKKNLDDMAEKYKEEMMRIYNKKRASEHQEDTPEREFQKESEKKHGGEASGGEDCKPESNARRDEQFRNNNSCDDEKLMHPPMPKIPYEDSKEGSGGISGKPNDDCKQEKAKFPTAKELISMDCSDNCGENNNGEESVPAAAMYRQELPKAPDARFESEGNIPDENDNDDGHMQGNYNFCTAPDEKCDSGNSESGGHRGMFRNSAGQGYLQAEVTEQGSGSPIAGAAVVVVRKIGDYDSLEAILTTDSHGMTEAIALDVPDCPAVQGDDSDPCGEYMVTVYKEGFYTVNMLSVPIFDTIKSIQPVEMQAETG